MNSHKTVQFERGDTPMLYTLGQASKAVGKAKGTIKNAIDKGHLSAKKDKNGQYQIEPVELHRVYPLHTEQSKMNAVTPPDYTPLNTPEISILQAQVKLLEETLEDVRQDRDEWRKQAQQLALAPPQDTAGRRRRGLLGFSWGWSTSKR